MIRRRWRAMADALRGERGSASLGPITLGMRADPRMREQLRDVDDREALTPGGFVDRYWAELIAAAIGGALTVYLLWLFTRFALPPSGDSGQWLAVSRWYLGQDVPADRSIATLPPLVPALLAAFSIVAGKPGAIVVLAALSYAAIAGLAYLLGRRMSGAPAGGLLAVVAIAAIQPQLFEMFAVGAYPQIIALIGMGLILWALLALVDTPDDDRSWLHLGAGVAITVFSHTPSATVMLPPLVTSLAYVAWSHGDRRGVAKRAARVIVPVFAVWAIFLFINRGVVFDYANVPAAFELKGPDQLFANVWRDNVQRAIFGAGLFALFAVPLLARNPDWKGRRDIALAVWTGTVIMLIGFAIVRQTGTDYPRFAAYLILPLGLATAAGVHALNLSRSATIALVAPVMLFAGYEGVRHFDTASRFYGLNERSDELRGISSWLNDQPGDGGVIAATRETKWLQALTGRDSLLYLPRVAITRPWEVERAQAAEVVMRASGGIESGRMLTTVNDGGTDFGKIIAVGVRIDTFDKGVYEQTLQVKDQQTVLSYEAYGVTARVRLTSMIPSPTVAYSDAEGEHLMTTFSGADGLPVQLIRIVTIDDRDLSIARIDYYVGLPEGVRPRSLVIGTDASDPIEIESGSEFWISATQKDGDELPLRVETSWTGDPAPPAGANPLLRWRRATAVIDVGEGDQRVPYTQLYDPAALLARDNIRYIIDRNGDGASFPIIRQRALAPVYQNGEYSVYDVAQ